MKKSKNPFVRTLILNVVIAAGSLILLILTKTILRNWLIIHLGVRKADGLQTSIIAFFCIIAIFILIDLALIYRGALKRYRVEAQERDASKEREKVITDYAKDDKNPLKVRKRLEQLEQEYPQIENLIQRCLGQMDSMDRLQEKQEELIGQNEALYLKQTVDVLERLECQLCENYRSIINLCIADALVSEAERAEIEQVLNENDQKLGYARKMLRASARRINSYNAGNKSGDEEILSWIETLDKALEGQKA